MPFTLAHPAAAVPLLRPLGRYGVLSALVIGSLVPDFSYFLPFPVPRSRSHDLWGLFWFCMPMGVATYALFHTALAAPAIDLMPAALRSRCLAVQAARAKPALVAIAVSLFVGATTHIAWDAFTHAGAPIVRVSRALRFHLGTVSGYPISVYTILQHVSTLGGMALVLVWVLRWQRHAPPATSEPRSSMRPWLRGVAVAGVLGLALVLWAESERVRPLGEHTLRGLQLFVRRAVPVAIASLALAFGTYAAAWQVGTRLSGSSRADG
jgi:Domain of unknown function (DUF4184)